jgi:hypothetical protein
VLWLLEDFSAGGVKEEKELLDCNIVARLSALIDVLIGRL